MINYILCGDSWAEKAYNFDNYDKKITDNDVCLGNFLPGTFTKCITLGQGNLDVLKKLCTSDIDPNIPLLWIFTEPGRDWATIYNQDDEFAWLKLEDYIERRQQCIDAILERIANSIKNPIGFIGGLSDFTTQKEMPKNWTIIHPSWQEFIASQLLDNRFEFGWGASDVGWRMHSNNVKPSKQLTFLWDEQIKEWCYWQDHEFFCHEHPTLKATKFFAAHIKKDFIQWLKKCNQI